MVGDTFSVGIYVDDVADLLAFQISIGFTSGLVEFVENSIVLGDNFLPAAGSNFEPGIPSSEPDDEFGLDYVYFITVFPDAAVTPLTDGGLLFSLSFVARKAGSADILAFFPSIDYLQDSGGGEGLPSDIQVTQVTNGAVTVLPQPTTVPEPGTLLLLSTGFAASVVASRRRQRRATSRH